MRWACPSQEGQGANCFPQCLPGLLRASRGAQSVLGRRAGISRTQLLPLVPFRPHRGSHLEGWGHRGVRGMRPVLSQSLEKVVMTAGYPKEF